MCFLGGAQRRCFSMWRDVIGMSDPKPVVIENSLNWDLKFSVLNPPRR